MGATFCHSSELLDVHEGHCIQGVTNHRRHSFDFIVAASTTLYGNHRIVS
jgi:hypothetical protein